MKKHGGMIYDKNSKILDFSANIHPEGVPAEVKKAMMEALEASSYYPDPECGDLRYSIAEKEHVKMEHVICGNGAAELIFHLAFAVGAKTLLLPVPSFLEYEDAFLAAAKGNLMIEKYQIDPVSFLIKEDLLDKMDASVDVLVLCQPNNPTGQLVEMNVMQRILDRAKEQNIVLLLDECFLDFVIDGKRYSVIPRYQEYPNVFILKSFTKMYGIPGIRLGYGICSDTRLLKQLRTSLQPWNVSHVAQAAGIAACGMKEYEKWTVDRIAKNREWLIKRLRLLGFQVWEGSANYVFFRVKGCTDLCEICLRQEICIRSCSNYRGLEDDYYRIAVKTEEENRRLIRTLTEWKEGKER